MEPRITFEDVVKKAERVNSLLTKINLKPGRRYDYTAIDITDKSGRILSTLIAGLTNREAYDLLYCIEEVLVREIS
jgi:hypothetical protein